MFKKFKKQVTITVLGALLFSASPAHAWNWKHFLGFSFGVVAVATLYSWWKSSGPLSKPPVVKHKRALMQPDINASSVTPQSLPNIYDKAALDSTQFHGAHVLPVVTIQPINTLEINVGQPEKFYVLGREAVGKDANIWSALGGSKDPGENALTAAARECYEESAKLLFDGSTSPQDREKHLNVTTGNTTHVVKHTHRGHTNVVYITQFPQSTVENYCKQFHTVRSRETEFHFKEMSAVALVKCNDFTQAVSGSADFHNTLVRAYVFDDRTGNGKPRTIPIRPFLVPTLQSFCRGQKDTLIFEK